MRAAVAAQLVKQQHRARAAAFQTRKLQPVAACNTVVLRVASNG